MKGNTVHDRNFSKNNTVIPPEILQAREEGKLVFFCGAGISRYMELPDYRGLVKDVCKKANLDESKYSKTDEFDLALHGIARELNPHDPVLGDRDMREFAYQSLSAYAKDKTADLHQAILELSEHDGGHLLVTTNVDRLFHLACEQSGTPLSSYEYEVGPRLSFPDSASNRPLVFLHGLLPENNNDAGAMRDLILTTADFGNAYLRYGWSTRFLIELFHNFTVLFLGYSMKDRIMRYLVDAIGSSQNAGKFKRPYALVLKEGKSARKQRESLEYWEARGITPIECENPDAFKAIILSWHESAKQGVVEMTGEIMNIVSKKYVKEKDNAPEIGRLAWLLQRPGVADGFAEYLQKSRENPPMEKPDIAWLVALQKYTGKSDSTGIIPSIFSVPGADGKANLLHGLNSWIMSNLGSNALCDYIIENAHRTLNDALLDLLKNRFFVFTRHPGVNDNYALFWRGIYKAHLEKQPQVADFRVQHLPEKLKQHEDMILHFLETTQSFEKSSRSFTALSYNTKNEPHIHATIRNLDIRMLFDDDKEYAQRFAEKYMFFISNELARHWEIDKKAGEPFQSRIDRTNSSSSFRHRSSRELLLHLCIAGLEHIVSDQNNHDTALTILDYWSMEYHRNGISDFGRLAMYAMNRWPDVFLNDYLSKFLSFSKKIGGNILCDPKIHIGLSTILKEKYHTINDTNKQIITALLSDGLSAYKDDREKYCLLSCAKHISQKEHSLPVEVMNAVEKFKFRVPSEWPSNTAKWSYPRKHPQSPEVTKIKKAAFRKYAYGKISDVDDYNLFIFSRKHPKEGFSFAVSLLKKLNAIPKKYRKNTIHEIQNLFNGVEAGIQENDAEKHLFLKKTIAIIRKQIITENEKELLRAILSLFSFLIPQTGINKSLLRKILSIWRYLFSLSKNIPLSKQKTRNSVHCDLAFCLIRVLSGLELKVGDGIPESLRDCFAMFFGGSHKQERIAHLAFAENLCFLHQIDPAFCNQYLRPLFFSKRREKELWTAYFRNPSCYPALLKDFAEGFHRVFKNAYPIWDDKDDMIIHDIYHLMLSIRLDSKNLLQDSIVTGAIKNASDIGIECILNELFSMLFLDRNRDFEPVIQHIEDILRLWPQSRKIHTEENIEIMTAILLSSRMHFPKLFEIVEQKRIIHAENIRDVEKPFSSLLGFVDPADYRGPLETSYTYHLHHTEHFMRFLRMLYNGFSRQEILKNQCIVKIYRFMKDSGHITADEDSIATAIFSNTSINPQSESLRGAEF